MYRNRWLFFFLPCFCFVLGFVLFRWRTKWARFAWLSRFASHRHSNRHWPKTNHMISRESFMPFSHVAITCVHYLFSIWMLRDWYVCMHVANFVCDLTHIPLFFAVGVCLLLVFFSIPLSHCLFLFFFLLSRLHLFRFCIELMVHFLPCFGSHCTIVSFVWCATATAHVSGSKWKQ